MEASNGVSHRFPGAQSAQHRLEVCRQIPFQHIETSSFREPFHLPASPRSQTEEEEISESHQPEKYEWYRIESGRVL